MNLQHTEPTAQAAILPPYMDSTMLSCLRSCPRKFFNEFVLGLRPSQVSIDLHCGGAFSQAVEHFYKAFYTASHLTGLPPTERLAAAKLEAFQHFMTFWGDMEAPHGSAKTRDNTWLAFEEYLRTFPPLTDHVQPYFVAGLPTFEFTFAIPLEPAGPDPAKHFPLHPVTGEPWLYTGRFDMVGTYCGVPAIRDEKTTKQAGPTWADQWDLRGQFIGYTWAAKASGLDIHWTVIRGIVIQKTSIRCLEAIKQYPDHLLARWHEQLRRSLWTVRQMWEDNQYFDYNFAESCTSYGGCMYRNACLAADPQPWLDTFVVRRWNPLQKDPIDSRAAAKPEEALPDV